jgi:hypothetical protein
MMFSRVLGMGKLSVVPALVVFALGGCGSRSTLPSTVVVDLPDGTTTEVEQGAGVTSLADTTWRFLRATGTAQGLPFLTISFGSEGNLEGFSDNTIAPQVFGSEILFDGEKHGTSVSGVAYAASTYGAETVDGSGFTFAGRMTAWAGPVVVGQATATAIGTFDPDDPNTMTGTFAFTTSLNFVSIPEAEMDEEFFFVAHRVVE